MFSITKPSLGDLPILTDIPTRTIEWVRHRLNFVKTQNQKITAKLRVTFFAC